MGKPPPLAVRLEKALPFQRGWCPSIAWMNMHNVHKLAVHSGCTGHNPPAECAMKCAAWPCRQGTVSCSTCIEEPKYPPTMAALIEGNSLREPQRSQRAGS